MRPTTFLALATLQAGVLSAQQDSVYIRIVDVGPGLCTITQAPPNDTWMVFDAGHYFGTNCLEAAEDLIDQDDVDLMVISHTDSDHLGDADDILDNFDVGQLIHTGFDRPSVGTNLGNFLTAATTAAGAGTSVRALSTEPISPGETVALGDGVVTLLGGWSTFPIDELPDQGERNNVVSIVARLDYDGRSILYGGDAVGRHIDDPANRCAFGEMVMVVNHLNGIASLDSDVLIAPHHGADNGSSRCFINAVTPEWVVFSAGSSYEHPREATAERYIAAGVDIDHMLRTDRGDDEGGDEWSDGAEPGCNDPRDDDDIEIIIREGGELIVRYADPTPPACN